MEIESNVRGKRRRDMKETERERETERGCGEAHHVDLISSHLFLSPSFFPSSFRPLFLKRQLLHPSGSVSLSLLPRMKTACDSVWLTLFLSSRLPPTHGQDIGHVPAEFHPLSTPIYHSITSLQEQFPSPAALEPAGLKGPHPCPPPYYHAPAAPSTRRARTGSPFFATLNGIPSSGRRLPFAAGGAGPARSWRTTHCCSSSTASAMCWPLKSPSTYRCRSACRLRHVPFLLANCLLISAPGRLRLRYITDVPPRCRRGRRLALPTGAAGVAPPRYPWGQLGGGTENAF